MTEKNHELFDLAATLSGGGFPETEVPVFFNERLGFAINSLRETVSMAERYNEEKKAEKAQKELDALLKKVKNERYVVTLRGIPEGMRVSIIEKVLEEFPVETDLFGNQKPNLARDKAMSKAFWEAQIVKITLPSGEDQFFDEAGIESLIEQSPTSVVLAINAGLDELSEGSKAGYEYAVSEVDFL